jgi:hypothetical protein
MINAVEVIIRVANGYVVKIIQGESNAYIFMRVGLSRRC